MARKVSCECGREFWIASDQEAPVVCECGRTITLRQQQASGARAAASDDRIRIECPHCGRGFRVKRATLGKTGPCPKCKQVFTIAEAPVASPVSATEVPAGPREEAAAPEVMAPAGPAAEVAGPPPAAAPDASPAPPPRAPEAAGTIRVSCPHCGGQFEAKSSLIGKTGPCPRCRQPLTITDTAVVSGGGTRPTAPGAPAEPPREAVTPAVGTPPAAPGPLEGAGEPSTASAQASSPAEAPSPGEPAAKEMDWRGFAIRSGIAVVVAIVVPFLMWPFLPDVFTQRKGFSGAVSPGEFAALAAVGTLLVCLGIAVTARVSCLGMGLLVIGLFLAFAPALYLVITVLRLLFMGIAALYRLSPGLFWVVIIAAGWWVIIAAALAQSRSQRAAIQEAMSAEERKAMDPVVLWLTHLLLRCAVISHVLLAWLIVLVVVGMVREGLGAGLLASAYPILYVPLLILGYGVAVRLIRRQLRLNMRYPQMVTLGRATRMPGLDKIVDRAMLKALTKPKKALAEILAIPLYPFFIGYETMAWLYRQPRFVSGIPARKKLVKVMLGSLITLVPVILAGVLQANPQNGRLAADARGRAASEHGRPASVRSRGADGSRQRSGRGRAGEPNSLRRGGGLGEQRLTFGDYLNQTTFSSAVHELWELDVAADGRVIGGRLKVKTAPAREHSGEVTTGRVEGKKVVFDWTYQYDGTTAMSGTAEATLQADGTLVQVVIDPNGAAGPPLVLRPLRSRGRPAQPSGATTPPAGD